MPSPKATTKLATRRAAFTLEESDFLFGVLDREGVRSRHAENSTYWRLLDRFRRMSASFTGGPDAEQDS